MSRLPNSKTLTFKDKNNIICIWIHIMQKDDMLYNEYKHFLCLFINLKQYTSKEILSKETLSKQKNNQSIKKPKNRKH